MKNDIHFTQEHEDARHKEVTLPSRAMHPFDRLELDRDRQDEVTRANIMAVNPGFTVGQLAGAATMLLTSTNLGIRVVSSTGYARLLMPDGSMTAAVVASATFVIYNVNVPGAVPGIPRFLAVIPCTAQGVQTGSLLSLGIYDGRFTYLDLSNCPTVADVSVAAPWAEGILLPPNATKVQITQAQSLRKLTIPSSANVMSALVLYNNPRLALIDGGGCIMAQGAYTWTSSSSSPYWQQGYIDVTNCALSTDALYFLLDKLGLPEGPGPSFVRLSGNPCLPGNTNLLDGENYSAAQVYALALAKNFTITS